MPLLKDGKVVDDVWAFVEDGARAVARRMR